MTTTAATAAATAAAVSTWKLDPAHSGAEFKVKHMMISNVKGRFHGLTGLLHLDEADPTRSSVEATIDAATIDTGDAQRDAHLKSADFLEVEKYPGMSFRSDRVTRKGEGYEVGGELTIHGVSHPAIFEVEDVSQPSKDPWGNLRIGLSATTKISRKEYGLTWNSALETGGVLVGDQVTIGLDVQFIKG